MISMDPKQSFEKGSSCYIFEISDNHRLETRAMPEGSAIMRLSTERTKLICH